MADNLQTFAAICAGGLVTNVDPITQSSKMPGSAISLINMEPSLEGGYRRISGFSNSYGTMPGEGKVLGLTVNGEINQGIFAARKPETGLLIKSAQNLILPAPAVNFSIIIDPSTIPRTIGTRGQFNLLKI